MNKKYRFIVFAKGRDSSNLQIMDIYNIQENLTESQLNDKINWYWNSGFSTMCDYKAEEM